MLLSLTQTHKKVDGYQNTKKGLYLRGWGVVYFDQQMGALHTFDNLNHIFCHFDFFFHHKWKNNRKIAKK